MEMHPELDPKEYGKNGGKRPGAGRPKGSTTQILAAKRAQASGSQRFISQKRERELWDHAIKLAVKNRNLNALIRILITLAEFHYGKPYEAINPAMAGKGKESDGRLLAAIKNLNIVSLSHNGNVAAQLVENKGILHGVTDVQTASTNSDIEADQIAGESGADREQIDR